MSRPNPQPTKEFPHGTVFVATDGRVHHLDELTARQAKQQQIQSEEDRIKLQLEVELNSMEEDFSWTGVAVDDLEQFNRALAQTEERADRAEHALEVALERNDRLQMELDIAREQLRQAQQTGPSTTRKSDLAKQIEQLKKERDAAVEDAAKSKKSLQNGNANFTRLFNEAKKERDTAKQSLKTGNANFTKRFSEVQEQLNHVRQQLKQANERLNKGRQMYNETDNELEAVKAELESTEAYWSEKVEDLQHQLAARDKELAGLKKKGRRMDSGWNKYGETPY